MPRHAGYEIPVGSDGQRDYMAYLRMTRAALGAAAATSGILAILYVARLTYNFGQSAAHGESDLNALPWVVGAFLFLLALTVGTLWVPALMRTAVLRRRMPNASFYLAKLIPGFWESLAAVDPAHEPGRRLQNTVLSVDGGVATLWRGVLRPRMAAVLPLAELTRIDTDRLTSLPYQRRLIVLTFRLGEVSQEVPLPLRRVAGFGFWRLSETAQSDVVRRLSWSISSANRGEFRGPLTPFG